jgi:hypothetical protein
MQVKKPVQREWNMAYKGGGRGGGRIWFFFDENIDPCLIFFVRLN